MRKTQSYLVDDEGNFRFTSEGLKEQAPLLAKAGIDARSIRTHEQYLQARQAARPYFVEYLQEGTERMLEGKPDTLEWRAIRSIAFGTLDEQKKLVEKLRRKQSFRIV